MPCAEPAKYRSAPAGAGQPRFCIAPTRRGFVVTDRLGRVGGIFVSEAAARHFIFEETGGEGGAILVDRSTVVTDPFRMSAA